MYVMWNSSVALPTLRRNSALVNGANCTRTNVRDQRVDPRGILCARPNVATEKRVILGDSILRSSKKLERRE